MFSHAGETLSQPYGKPMRMPVAALREAFSSVRMLAEPLREASRECLLQPYDILSLSIENTFCNML